jgi:queuine tRNA-ribosyltransferase
MSKAIRFSIDKKMEGLQKGRAGRVARMGRVGKITTPHGVIETPSFVVVGTKASVKSLSPEQVLSLGAEVLLANTYHLYLQPGHEIIKKAGGIHSFAHWNCPTMTDSGGFQAFSLGAAFGTKLTKITKGSSRERSNEVMETKPESSSLSSPPTLSNEDRGQMAKITEHGVEFKSILDGSKHIFTPEKSIKIQHAIGADIIFAFDECTSPLASHQYQKEAMDRTHHWAMRSLEYHQKNSHGTQGLFGIVQGGRFEDLRKESAKTIGAMDFDGFGIGGSFDKEDMNKAVSWVNEILPENKPRHLLGIGEPADLFMAVENGCDTFDCVAPTRIARNGCLYTQKGSINIFNAQFVQDFSAIDKHCQCYTCKNYTKAYLSHLFRAKEISANTLASIHNLYFIVQLVKNMRLAILEDSFEEYKKSFLHSFYGL